MSNYYEQSDFNSIEKAVLAEDLEFDSLSKDITGKFFINAMTPSLSTDEAVDRREGKYYTSNYIKLNIPKYMLYNFIDAHINSEGLLQVSSQPPFIIPKDTIFFIEFLGGDLEIEKMNIIGIGAQNNE